jgi:hypothetical protein
MIKRFQKGQEDKPTWKSAPQAVKTEVERALGEKVISGRRVWGGYGPSATFRLKLESGGLAFFKGVDRAGNAIMQSAIRREMQVYKELPGIQPWAPRLLGTITLDDWNILLLEFIYDARGTSPWTARHVRSAIEGLAGLQDAFAGKSLPRWVDTAADFLFKPRSSDPAGWWTLKRDAHNIARLAEKAGHARDDAAAWLKRFVPRLMELESSISAPRGVSTLLHMDVRSDNLLFRGDGSPVLVDWPYVSSGPGVIDTVGFMIAVAAEGGPELDQMLSWYADASGSPISSDDLLGAVAAFGGYFASRSGMPDIPGLPRVRPFQRAQLVVSLRWLAHLLDTPVPAWLSEVQPQPASVSQV